MQRPNTQRPNMQRLMPLQNRHVLKDSAIHWREQHLLKSWQALTSNIPCVFAGFANEGQFLLMNDASLTDLNQRMASQAVPAGQTSKVKGSATALSRFRPNLLVGGHGMAAYAEDGWQELQIGPHRFSAAGEFVPVCQASVFRLSGYLGRVCSWSFVRC